MANRNSSRPYMTENSAVILSPLRKQAVWLGRILCDKWGCKQRVSIYRSTTSLISVWGSLNSMKPFNDFTETWHSWPSTPTFSPLSAALSPHSVSRWFSFLAQKLLKSFPFTEFQEEFSSSEKSLKCRYKLLIFTVNWTKSVSGVISWRE